MDSTGQCCCSWCCCCRPAYTFCRKCGLCCDCCLCLPPPPPPSLNCVREKVFVPYPCPYPVYPCCNFPPEDPCCYQGVDGFCYPNSYWAWPTPRRVYKAGQSILPGYRGHIPGFKFHSAGRTFGSATRDTRCIMSQWPECCPQLPCRIWEQ